MDRDHLITYIDFARLMVERDRRIQEGIKMARVGFRGLGKYQDVKLAELDQKADKLADRLDALTVKGSNAIDAHAKMLDQREREISDFEKAAVELSNGAPPLDDSPKDSPPSDQKVGL